MFAVVAATAGVAYAIYNKITEDYYDDFEDDFDDLFEDDEEDESDFVEE